MGIKSMSIHGQGVNDGDVCLKEKKNFPGRYYREYYLYPLLGRTPVAGHGTTAVRPEGWGGVKPGTWRILKRHLGKEVGSMRCRDEWLLLDTAPGGIVKSTFVKHRRTRRRRDQSHNSLRERVRVCVRVLFLRIIITRPCHHFAIAILTSTVLLSRQTNTHAAPDVRKFLFSDSSLAHPLVGIEGCAAVRSVEDKKD
jgi:hypothetical protein